jgi:hypothetical protein
MFTSSTHFIWYPLYNADGTVRNVNWHFCGEEVNIRVVRYEELRSMYWRCICAVLCCSVLFCAVLCCAVLCCAVLCRAVPCCVVPCRAVLCLHQVLRKGFALPTHTEHYVRAWDIWTCHKLLHLNNKKGMGRMYNTQGKVRSKCSYWDCEEWHPLFQLFSTWVTRIPGNKRRYIMG